MTDRPELLDFAVTQIQYACRNLHVCQAEEGEAVIWRRGVVDHDPYVCDLESVFYPELLQDHELAWCVRLKPAE